MRTPTQKFVDAAMTLCGLILAATPLAIWASPTKTSFYYVLAFAATAMFGVLTLAQYETPSDSNHHGRPKPLITLPDKFINILQELQPFVHHHRPRGGQDFRRAMERAKRILGQRD